MGPTKVKSERISDSAAYPPYFSMLEISLEKFQVVNDVTR